MPINNPYGGYLGGSEQGAGGNPYGGYLSSLLQKRQQGDQQTMAVALTKLRQMIAAMPGASALPQQPQQQPEGYLPPKPALEDVYSPDDYEKGVSTAESGDDYTAVNKMSGAGGRYQFIVPTWDNIAKQHPELQLTSEGRTSDTPEGRRQQQAAFRMTTQSNAQNLKSTLGRAPTHAELYLAHFLGPGYATAVLQNRETPVETLVPKSFVEQNPILRNVDGATLLQALGKRFNR